MRLVASRRLFLVGAVLLPLLWGGSAAAEAVRLEHSDASANRVPLLIRRNAQIVLHGEVNGRPARIWLDSGVSHLILATEFANGIGLRKRGQLPVRGHDVSVDRRGPAKVRIGDLRIQVDETISFDLASRFGPIGEGIDAVIGRDLFEKRIVDLDLPARGIAFYDRAGFSPPEAALALELHPVGPLRSIPVSIGGRDPIPALFDLGSNAPIRLTAEYAARIGLLEGRRASTVPVINVGGITTDQVATIGPVAFGTTVFDSVPITISTRDGPLGLSAVSGFDFLSRFRLITDYEADRLWIISNEAEIGRPFERDRSGIRSMPEGDRLRVIHISIGSPAEAEGWREGDVIVAVNGEVVRTDGDEVWDLWARGAPGTVVRFTMADGTERRLTLEEYY